MATPVEVHATRQPRSRRALLAGALGGLAAWAASTAARVSPAEAAAGDPIRMGRLNRSGGTQTVLQTDNSGAGLLVRQASGAPAIRGEATTGRAVVGVAEPNGIGVWGSSPNDVGVYGSTISGSGVLGAAEGGRGVYGYSTTGTGVVGFSASGPYAGDFQGKLHVHGYQDIDELAGDPLAPGPSMARLFARDNGSGKTQLCVRFPTGAVQVIAAEA